MHIRRSILFWKWQISHRATVTNWYLWGFFTLQALRNSFQGALPPTVSQSFLLAGYSPTNEDGPASTAIWANCWVGDDSSDLPTSQLLQPFSPTHSGLAAHSVLEGSLFLVLGGPSASARTWAHILTFTPRFLGITFVLTMLELERKSQSVRSLNGLTRVLWPPFWICNYCDITFLCKDSSLIVCYFLQQNVWWVE